MQATQTTEPLWGSTGKVVYERTYSRTKPDGSKETWAETAARVAEGNLSLVYGPRETWLPMVEAEYDELYDAIYTFKVLPAGRHLWASGVKGRQYLQNCFVSGWTRNLSDHFAFTFSRLMEGGGVGANYSSYLTGHYGAPTRQLTVHIVCDSQHKDYERMRDAGTLSEAFSPDWPGAFVIEDSREGWSAALSDLIDTFYADDVKHTDRVYDVTLVRPEGARLRTFGGTASGPNPLGRMLAMVTDVLNVAAARGSLNPIDLMDIEHAIATCVVAGGVRRSARMSIVHWNDPYVYEFISCKTDFTKHWSTNISVEVDQEFFDALEAGDEHAKQVLADVSRGMVENGEPGFWNSTYSNVGEITPVHCTNPCGEITLNEWEPCTLGHVNLEAFAPAEIDGLYDYKGLKRAHQLMARFLVRATFGDTADDKQAAVMARNRRIGCGHTGVQGFFAKCGVRFSELSSTVWAANLLEGLRDTVTDAANAYAFELRIPAPVKTTTIAPTGTISKMPGVSEGIHPVFAKYFIRRVRFSTIRPDERRQLEELKAQGYVTEKDMYDQSGNTVIVQFPTKEKLVAECVAMGLPEDVVEAADELSFEQMLSVQELYQTHYANNAVSFTANVDPKRYTPGDVAATLERYLPVLKGTTVFPEMSRPQSPYERISKEDFELMEYLASVDSSNDEDCATGACPVK